MKETKETDPKKGKEKRTGKIVAMSKGGFGLQYPVDQGIIQTRHGIRTLKQAREIAKELGVSLDTKSLPKGFRGSGGLKESPKESSDKKADDTKKA